MNLNDLAKEIHQSNINAGWWTDPESGEDLKEGWWSKYVFFTKLCLAHSEISEAVEGERKGLMDDKLPHRPMGEVEIADVFIRLLDYCGAKGYDIDGAIKEKREFNSIREDHKLGSRNSKGGKSV